MPVTEKTIIKLESRNFIMLIVAIISIVSSFWIGYGNIMQKLDRMEISQKSQAEVIIGLQDRIAKLENRQ